MNISKVTTSLGAAAAEKAKPERVVASAAAVAAFTAVSIQKRGGGAADDPSEDPTRKKAKTELLLGTPSSAASLPAKAVAPPTSQQLLYQRAAAGQQVKVQVQAQPKIALDTQEAAQAAGGGQEDGGAWEQQQIIVCNFGSGAEMSTIKTTDDATAAADKQTYASFTKKETASSSSSSSSSTASIISIEPSGSGLDHTEDPGKAEDLDYVLMPAVGGGGGDNAVPGTTVTAPTGAGAGATSTIILNATNNNGATGGGGGGTGGTTAGTTTILTQKAAGQSNYNIFNTTTVTGSSSSSSQTTGQPTTTTTTLLNRVNLHNKMKTTQLVVNAKKLSEVTQTTAKVSIGNKTISVPLLKPLMSGGGAATAAGGATIVESKQLLQPGGGGGQVTTVVSAAPAAVQQGHPHVHPHPHHNFTKLIKRVPKNTTGGGTIVSFSGLQIKPATKIVAAKVVNKKMALPLQLQHHHQQQQHQQQQQTHQLHQVTSLTPATGSIVTITTTNPSQTYAMVQEAASSAASVTGASSSEDDAQATTTTPRKITAYSENIQKILNKSKSQEGQEEFANINSVVIKPLDKNALNCPPSFNIFKQQQQQQQQVQVQAAAQAQGQATPVTVTMTSSASDLGATSSASSSTSSATSSSTVSVSAGTICINSPVMGSRPILSIQNKNISLVLSKTTMAQQKHKMITTTTGQSAALQMHHHALVQDKAEQGGGGGSSSSAAAAPAGGGGAATTPMQLKLTTLANNSAAATKLSVVSLATTEGGAGAKLEEIVVGAADAKVKLQVKQQQQPQEAVVVKESAASGTPSDQERSEELGTTPEKQQRLNANNATMMPINISQAQNQSQSQAQVAPAPASAPAPPPPAGAATATNSNQRTGADDSNNALLKQLLQNSSSSHSLNQISLPSSAHVASGASGATSAPLSARKVINVQAPCMGMPCSLEDQLARPSRPPVPTATTPGSSISSASGGSSGSGGSGSVAPPTTTTTVAGGAGAGAGQQVVVTAATAVSAVVIASGSGSGTGTGSEAKLQEKSEQTQPLAVATIQNQNPNQNHVPPPPHPHPHPHPQGHPQAQTQLQTPPPAPQQQQQQQQLQVPPPHQVKQTVQIVSKETSFISGPVSGPNKHPLVLAPDKPAEQLLAAPPPYELATAPVSSNVTISISTKQPTTTTTKELQQQIKSKAVPMEQGGEQEPPLPAGEQGEQLPPHPEQSGGGAIMAAAAAGGALVTASWTNNSNHLETTSALGAGAAATTKMPFKPGEGAQKRKLPMHPQLDEKQLQLQQQQQQQVELPANQPTEKVQLVSYVKKSAGGGGGGPAEQLQLQPVQSQGQVQMQAQMQAAMQGQLAGQMPGQIPGHIAGQMPAQMQLQVQQQQHQHQLQVAVHPQQQQQQLQLQHQNQQLQHQPIPIPMPTAMEPKAADQRKRRKREVQKPRRTNLNAGGQAAGGALKDLTGTLPAGAMVQLAGMPPGTQYIQSGAAGTAGHVISGGVTIGGGGGGGSGTGGTGVGASPMLKKRVRKFSKVEEDHDAFTEKLLTHIRQMQPLQVLEPHLNRNFHFLVGSNEAAAASGGGGSPSASTAAASSSSSSSSSSTTGKLKSASLNNNNNSNRGWPLGRHLEGLEDCDGAILGRYGRVCLPGIPSLYDSERFGGSGGLVGGRVAAAAAAANRSPSPSSPSLCADLEKTLPMSSIQNDFYDQEFSTHIERNPRERLQRHIGAIRDCNLETIELVESSEGGVAAWAALPRLSRYPGLIILNGNSRCHGRMSPVALPEDPLTMRVPVSPLLRSCGEELRKAQQLELGMCMGMGMGLGLGSLSNNNNNNYQQKNQNVILALPASSSTENIAGVLRDLANLLHLTPALTCKIIEDKMGGDKLADETESVEREDEKQQQHKDNDFKQPLNVVSSHGHLRKILNGRRKLCRSCGNVVHANGLRVPRNSVPPLEEQLPRLAQLMAMLPRKSPPPPFAYFCDRSCFARFKWSGGGKEGQAAAEAAASLLLQPAGGGNPSSSMDTSTSGSNSGGGAGNGLASLAETIVKQEPEDEADVMLQGMAPNLPAQQRKCIVKCFSADCFAPEAATPIKLELEQAGAAGAAWETEASGQQLQQQQLEDTRQCVFCNQRGDGKADGPSRLLNFDVDKWVHLNCALWSNGVYETVSGALMNFQTALQSGLNQACSACHQLGATIKCFKSRCNSLYHLPCAIREECVFYKNKSVHCSAHGHALTSSGAASAAAGVAAAAVASAPGTENELSSLVVHRRVFVDRDENRQVATVMHYSELSNLLRVGNMTFLNVGQLLPHQLEAFHTPHYIYPIGYKVSRYYWCVRRPNRRCRYICSIAEAGCKPEFRIVVQQDAAAGGGDKEPEREFRDSSPSAVWQQILQPITRLRKVHKWLQLFPQHISGEDLFGLTEPTIVRILESLPGIETLTDYRFKYGRNPLLEFPLAINPSGAARTEPKQRQLLVWRKPHTQRTAGSCSSTQRMANSAAIAGEVACPYSKQFVHSKSSQYKKMKQEWRNNVYLARSKIQGLGLYAARDIEKHTMIIEYIGEVIRTEVSEIREKQYESKNRGIYMFRLDEDRVVDATLSGGLARYINHSCNPNCVTEIVEVDRDVRIIIFAKRKIYRGEELSYDYKFDIEDESHKIPCACGAPNCCKWMN